MEPTEDDWVRGYQSHGQVLSERMRDFVAVQKGARGDDFRELDLSGYDTEKLQGAQLHFYRLLQDAMAAPRPVRAVVRGGGGTGKSYAINCFRKWLADHDSFSEDNIAVVAPTGTAAYNVAGRTLHSALKLPVPLNQGTFQRLTSGPSLTQLQQTFRDVKVVVIDEMSMVGRRMLRAMDDRLRQAKAKPNKPFGGLSVFLCGDFGQLPPVGDVPMYDDGDKGGDLSKLGRATWAACTHSLELTHNHRQSGDASGFRAALWRLRCGGTTNDDYNLFATRGEHCVGGADFKDAMYLVATHALEREFNEGKLHSLNKPIFRIDATHTGGKAAQSAEEQDAGGLPKSLLLAEGAKTMLRTNLWTSAGLTNGAIGEFVQLITPRANTLPFAALVRFPSYTGPALFPDDPKLVPVPAFTSHFGGDGPQAKAFSRTQLPLALAWAITIHKAQGATYDKAIVNLGEKEIALGLTYVAFSRVRALGGLLLRGCYGVERVLRLNLHPKHGIRARAEEWLDTLPSRL